MNDEHWQWIRAAQAGDQEAFAHLVHSYKDYLFRTAYAILRDHGEAEDVVQEAFVKAFLSLSGLKDERAFPTWITTITTRLALDSIRRRRPDVSLGDSEAVPHRDRGAVPASVAELRLDLAAALAKLSPEHRAVIALREIQGFDYREIAEILGIPIGTVRSRLHTARMQLRNLLSAHEERG
ncbi:RNA polymerase sigma factor [Alicyclobacillus macrosporangiidus]|uniref:RNA polymerase sigma factor n=1 Tax=Alicyclobacillus macrosporangiidus TaxID=392015 RepID=UPI00049809B6|nr:sigma-70 family RNA polymerase sigma factor [Alicyclobacillus macrosporangiidus]